MENKKLILISGITGAIGTACLSALVKNKDVVIYGISRQATHFKKYLEKNGKLPTSHLICNIGDIVNDVDCKNFINSIDFSKYQEIIYIHSVGFYPFEIDKKGNLFIDNDLDKDGINDKTFNLSYRSYFNIINNISSKNKQVRSIILGSISDKHKPEVHQSWWKSLDKIKKEMLNISSKNSNLSFYVLNISSVICPHEMITRPFVFQRTDANPKYWLSPEDVAKKIKSLIFNKKIKKYWEGDLFHKSNYFIKNYYKNNLFTKRKAKEIGF